MFAVLTEPRRPGALTFLLRLSGPALETSVAREHLPHALLAGDGPQAGSTHLNLRAALFICNILKARSPLLFPSSVFQS